MTPAIYDTTALARARAGDSSIHRRGLLSAFRLVHAALHGFHNIEAYELSMFSAAQDAYRTLVLDPGPVSLATAYGAAASMSGSSALSLNSSASVDMYASSACAGMYIYEMGFSISFDGASSVDEADGYVTLEVFGIEPNGMPLQFPLHTGKVNMVKLVPSRIAAVLGESAVVGCFATENLKFRFTYPNGAGGQVAKVIVIGKRGPVPEKLVEQWRTMCAEGLGVEGSESNDGVGRLGGLLSTAIGARAGEQVSKGMQAVLAGFSRSPKAKSTTSSGTVQGPGRSR